MRGLDVVVMSSVLVNASVVGLEVDLGVVFLVVTVVCLETGEVFRSLSVVEVLAVFVRGEAVLAEAPVLKFARTRYGGGGGDGGVKVLVGARVTEVLVVGEE